MMLRRRSAFLSASVLFTGIVSSALLLLSGCGVGNTIVGKGPDSGDPVGTNLSGILHGGPNPINNALMTLYTTTSNSSGIYGGTANVVTTTHTNSAGGFTFTLPSGSRACPLGEYAYVTASGGSSGALSTNSSILLMTPIGLCDTNYSYSSGTNTYLGSSLWIDEMTTAVSAYALGNFMTVTNAGVVNIGAPTNNHGTASASTPSAAGLGHAFANALAVINTNTGLPNPYYTPAGGSATAGIVPDAELYLLGNILQACVNSTGTTATPTATSNDGTSCGILFSMTTPPQSGAAVPANTMQAMLDLAKYPNPSVNNWNTGCTATGTGSSYVTTATTCLFNLSPATGAAYAGALTSAPPDWTMAVIYPAGTGVSGSNPGLAYPFYVALDYQDNVYVLNYNGGYNTNGSSSGATTSTNIIGFNYNGTPVFSTTPDTTDLTMPTIGTDTLGHVFGAATGSSTGVLKVYNTSSGSLAQTVTTGLNAADNMVIADPAGNIYVESGTLPSINLRKVTVGTYTVANATSSSGTFGPFLQLAWDSSVDLYGLSATTPNVEILPNLGTYSAPSFYTSTPGSFTYNSGTLSGTTGSNPPGVWGIAGNGLGSTSNNAYVLTSAGVTTITASGSAATTAIAAGSATSLPELSGDSATVPASFRGAWVDGSGTLFTPDGDNGGGQSGVAVYNATTGYLGTYKGCYVISSQCSGGITNPTAAQVPMYSARGLGIDSSGDVWVVSGASGTLTELIGVAAPTWPGLSMAKFGRPQ